MAYYLFDFFSQVDWYTDTINKTHMESPRLTYFNCTPISNVVLLIKIWSFIYINTMHKYLALIIYFKLWFKTPFDRSLDMVNH